MSKISNTSFEFYNNHAITLITISDTTTFKEISIIENETMRIGIHERNGYMLIAYKFGGLDWMPCTINYAINKDIPDIDTCYTNSIIILDSGNNVVADRDTAWSSKFSIKFRNLAKRQLRHKSFMVDFDYNKQCKKLIQNFDVMQFLKKACIEVIT